jgi:hypothetical protein
MPGMCRISNKTIGPFDMVPDYGMIMGLSSTWGKIEKTMLPGMLTNESKRFALERKHSLEQARRATLGVRM